jgi:2'-5' RNA ligase
MNYQQLIESEMSPTTMLALFTSPGGPGINPISDVVTTEEVKTYEFGVVMLEMYSAMWSKLQSLIHPDHVTKDGVSSSPHITILYGIHDGVSEEDVKNALGIYNNIERSPIYLFPTNIDTFSNQDADVLKFNLENSSISSYCKILRDGLLKLPSTVKFSDYKPHLTLAYLRKDIPGLVDLYTKKIQEELGIMAFEVMHLTYRDVQGKITDFYY